MGRAGGSGKEREGGHAHEAKGCDAVRKFGRFGPWHIVPDPVRLGRPRPRDGARILRVEAWRDQWHSEYSRGQDPELVATICRRSGDIGWISRTGSPSPLFRLAARLGATPAKPPPSPPASGSRPQPRNDLRLTFANRNAANGAASRARVAGSGTAAAGILITKLSSVTFGGLHS